MMSMKAKVWEIDVSDELNNQQIHSDVYGLSKLCRHAVQSHLGHVKLLSTLHSFNFAHLLRYIGC